jgi:DNA-binding response OmpR family regulator
VNSSNENKTPKTFSGKTLLLVDDDAVIHDLFSEYVKEEPYRLLHLFDGMETMATAKEKKPDLILLDVTMPFSDGRDICRKLKTDPETKDIPVIMVTAKDDHFDRLVCLDMGVDEYIAKPCSRMYIMSTIKKVLRKKESK